MMDDLISRQEAIKALWKSLYEYEDNTEKQFQESEDLDVRDWINHRNFVQNMNDIDRQTILNLPSSQQWIPCSDRLPKRNSDWKNVTVSDESGDTSFTYSSVGFYLSDGCWIVDNEPMENDSSIRVIAWMSLSEPYKEDSDG